LQLPPDFIEAGHKCLPMLFKPGSFPLAGGQTPHQPVMRRPFFSKDQQGGMSPILKKDAVGKAERLQMGWIKQTQPAPQRQQMGTLPMVDGV
jgi:hypothetical protein